MKLTIYMKSGNRISIGSVKDYEIKSTGNAITSLRIARSTLGRGEHLLVPTIDMSQIEAVTVNSGFWWARA